RMPSPASRAGSASATARRYPAAISRSAIGRPMLPRPTKPMRGLAVIIRARAAALLLAVDLGEDLARRAEGVDRGGHAGIDPGLQEDLGDLLARDAVVERAPDMQLDLVRPVERGQHGEVEEAARLARQAGPRPHLAPAIFRDEILQHLAEAVGAGERAVDMLGAQHLPTHGETLVVEILVHPFLLKRCATGNLRHAWSPGPRDQAN